MKILNVDNSMNNLGNVQFKAIENNSKYITEETVTELGKIAGNYNVSINDKSTNIEDEFWKDIECRIEGTSAKSKYPIVNRFLNKYNINHPLQNFSVNQSWYKYQNPCDRKNSLYIGGEKSTEDIQKKFIEGFKKAIEALEDTIMFKKNTYKISQNRLLRMLKIK